MANLPPGDPKLVSQIVNHLKSQGLFDQFRRDCLADVDTKPAYQNLRQRVDNFVTNHLASHTWSPHLNKNQLRNNIRQQVLKSGMLESGIDRIISQVVDPKINHTFRPQVEKVVQEFLATLNNKEEASVTLEEHDERSESFTSAPSSMPAVAASTSVASDAMSILETISSLNQEATAARALTETTNHRNEKVAKKLFAQQSVDINLEKDHCFEDLHDMEKSIPEATEEVNDAAIKQEVNDVSPVVEEVKLPVTEVDGSLETKDTSGETEEQRLKAAAEKSEKKPETNEKPERKEEKKESKLEKRNEHIKKSDECMKLKEEKSVKEREHEVEQATLTASEKSNAKPKTNDISKEELSLDSDMDACSDITVSSVHTSDLSSFDEESFEESAVSDSTEEGEITSDDEDKVDVQNKTKSVTEQSDTKPKSTRQSYVHKPFLYSKYYSDSDDELTVEQHRQSAAKEKEERLLRRRIKRERLEEKRKLKAAEKKKSLKIKSQGIELKSSKGTIPKSSSIKEVLKEQMFLEKRVAMSKKKSRDSRVEKLNSKEDIDEDSKESETKSESCEKVVSSLKEAKSSASRSDLSKPHRKSVEPVDDPKKRTPLQLDRSQQDGETRDPRKLVERRDSVAEDQQKPKTVTKTDKHSKKESGESEMQSKKSILKKDPKLQKTELERSFSEDRLPSRHRSKSESAHKGSEDGEQHRVKKKEDDNLNKPSLEDKSDRKIKAKNDVKPSTYSKDEKIPANENKCDEDSLKDSYKRERPHSTDKLKSEHRYKRSLSDPRPHRDSQSSSKHHGTPQRKSKTHSEDKNEGESANSDSSSKHEDGIHKDKRRTPSLDEKLSSKAMFKSKSMKPGDQDELTQKSARDKNYMGSSVEKHRKLKSDEKDSESRADPVPPASNSISKQGSHKSKHIGEKSKERSHSENRERLSSKSEKKYGDNVKSTNSRHNQKEVKRKEDGSKSDDKRSRERGNSIDSKSSKKSAFEPKGDTPKAFVAKKLKLESEKEGVSSAGDRVKVSTSSVGTETKEDAEARQATEIKEASEPASEDCPTASNSQGVHPHSEGSKLFSLKSKSKQGTIQSKPIKMSNTCRKAPPIIPTMDFHTTDNLITLTPSENARKKVPSSNTAADASNGNTEIARNSYKKSRIANPCRSDTGFPHTSASDQPNSARESSNHDCSVLTPVAVVPERTQLNDSEISTSDMTNQEEDYSQEQTITESSHSRPVLEEVSELDNTVSGNDVEEDSVMDVDVTDSNGKNIANENAPVFCEEESVFRGISSPEASVQSSILRTNMGDANTGSPAFSNSIPSLRIFEDLSRIDGEDAATSSSMGVSAQTSANFQTPNNETVRVSFDISRDDTASTTADAGNYSGEIDVAVLSDNSFEGASTSSSNYQANCTEGLFSDNSHSQAAEKNTATSSQCANYVSPEEARSSDNAVDAATSSVVNRIISGNSQDNSATSSDNAEVNAGTSEISEVITRAATSSDSTREGTSVPVVSEAGILHAATSSDSVAENDAVQSGSENVFSHLATSSDSASESDDSAPGVSENVISHAATSSSSVVDSSRELHAEGSVASSETDNENSAASSSNFMYSSPSDSRTWLKKSPEKDEDAASSSCALPRNSEREHKMTGFENVEDSRNASATSSTQHDGAFDDRFMEVMSSGSVKEYPANSSDIAMDSSSEASGSVGRDMYSGSSASCTSSGRTQSRSEVKERGQDKAKYNDTASSSSAVEIAGVTGPSQNGNDEAASSSSSSYTYSHMLHTTDNGSLSSETTEAAASSSFAMNSSSELLAIIPGNSDNTATSSSNSPDVEAADGCETNLNNNTRATASSSVAMDSSTGGDLHTRFARDAEHRSNTATSSSTLNTIKEPNVGPSDKDVRVTASSSTVAGDVSNESRDAVHCIEKANENAATSSDMMGSRVENSCHTLSNNAVCATTSTNNKSEIGNTEEMDGRFTVCELNSEATSSSAVENAGDNATSSNYITECSAEDQNASRTTCPCKHEEAASSSGLSSGMRLQEIRTQELISNEATEDATSTERSNEPVVRSRMTNRETFERNETDFVEGEAESSFAGSRNSSTLSLTGTAEQSVQLLAASTNSEDELAINSEDAVNERSDEKEDAVSSASSEEQKLCCNNSRQANLQAGEVETDGAVTSVGTEISNFSINESLVERSHVAIFHLGDHDVGQIAAAAACEEEESAVSHTSDAEVNENRVYEINMEDVVMEESESDLSPENRHENLVNVGAEPEPERPINNVILEEGEGAVTSTGITEENYREKRRQGIRESDSSCSCTEMDTVNVPHRQEPGDLGAIIEDDETAITSTGAKEDEEEGEGFVTSTGTASEDSSFSSGMEEHTSNAVIHTSDRRTENVYTEAEKEQLDQSLKEQESFENAEGDVLTYAPSGSTIISVSSQNDNRTGQASQVDIHVPENLSILEGEPDVILQNTFIQERTSVLMDPMGPRVLIDESIEPISLKLVSCSNNIQVNAGDTDGKSTNSGLSDNCAVVEPKEVDTSVTCIRDQLDDTESRSDLEASINTDAPSSPPSANEPVESVSHPADMGTVQESLSHPADMGTVQESVSHPADIGMVQESVKESSCELSDDRSTVPDSGKTNTSSMIEDGPRKSESEKTDDGEKSDDYDSCSSRTDISFPTISISECNSVIDLSRASEETKNEASLSEVPQESNSQISNEETDVSQKNEIMEDISQTNDSSVHDKEGDNKDDTTTFENVEAEQNGQETMLPEGESTPSDDAPTAQSQQTPKPCQPEEKEEKCTVEQQEPGSHSLRDLSDQGTTTQLSEEKEDSSLAHQSKSRGRKPLEKVQEKEKPSEEANETAVSSLKAEVNEPKAEPDKRKRGRPPKKRKLSDTHGSEKTAKIKLSSEDSSSTEDQDKSKENAHGSTVARDEVKVETMIRKCDDNTEKSAETVRRRGRPKSSISSSETESSESEKKRKKSQSEEEKNDDDKEDSENDEDDDEHKGATTRAASRLEAQRKLPHKPTTRAASKLGSPEPPVSKERRRKETNSPESTSKRTILLKSKTPQAHGLKRLREASPPLVRTRIQQTTEDVPAKRIKRQ